MWFVAAALAAPTVAQIEAATWSPVTTRTTDVGPVEVSNAEIGGMTCWRGYTTTDLSPDKLIAVDTDVPSVVRWSTAGVTRSEWLSHDGHTLEYWQYLDVPGWTMTSDRVWFIHSEISSSPTDAWEKWTDLPGGGTHADVYAKVKAEFPDAVEPRINVGEWRFKVDGDHTTVDYKMCTDPGGSIPSAVQNAATRRTLPDTVADLVREAKRRAGL